MAKVTRKKQGKQIDGDALSATNEIPNPQHLGRGLGSAFAMAVDSLKEAASMADKSEFLGVKKEEIDPYKDLHASLLPKGFDPRQKP